MRRKKRQNKITEKRNIQKEICRIPLLFLVLLSVMCTGSLTGCRVGNPQGQTELVPLNRNDTDSDKPDTAVNSGQKEQQTDREKLQICYVHVCGAVNQPGVYELTADSRLFEAIQMAGGLTEEAADQTLNQAEVIEDGSKIYVPTKEEVKAGMDNGGTLVQNEDNAEKAGSTSDGKIDINTAAKNELMTLSGIGEAKADAIVRYREEHGAFQKIEDLMEVEGIKEGVFQKVKDQMIIYVPKKGEPVPQSLETLQESAPAQQNQEEKINLNRATEAELQTISGIGAKKAQEIIRFRDEQGPFKTVEELKNVPGIGEKTVERLKDMLTVTG